MHGLGFETGWVDYNLYSKGTLPKGVLLPLPFISVDSKKFQGFSPLLVMDKFLSLSLFEDSVQLFKCQDCYGSQVFKQIQADRLLMEASQKAFTDATTKVLFSNRVALYTPSNYQQGSSLAHLDTNYENSTDFLMTAMMSSRIGKTLGAVIGNDNIFGSETMFILSEIGWPTLESPNAKPITISLDYYPQNGAIYGIPILYLFSLILCH